ncbi:unnamed protein product [Rotaria sp. Silwood2]|nr:unnamed protein product [Rotaria sp. Silwood2]
MSDVHDLAAEFIAGYDYNTSSKAIAHTQKIENQFRAADRFVENYIEPNLTDPISDDESNASSEDDEDNSDA